MRSYVDLCLLIRFIELTEERFGPHSPGTADEMLELWQAHESTMPSYVFHELYHCWQGLRLPFVYRYAKRTLREFPATIRWVRDQDLDLLSNELAIGGPVAQLGEMWSPSSPSPTSALVPAYGSLTPLDLLEGAATLAEFQMQHDEQQRTDCRVFDRWCKRNPSYTNAFGVCDARLNTPGFALRTFLPLVCQAFCTSDPTRAFAELTELAGAIRPSDEEVTTAPSLTWPELARSLIHEVSFETEPDAEEGYCRLSPRQMFSGPEHPIVGPLAREWENRCWSNGSDSSDYRFVLEMPGWIANDVLQECRDQYGPPFTVVSFHWLDGRRSVQLYGGGNASRATIEEELIPELLTAYGLLRRRTGLHFDARTRLCHHSDCQYYSANWCNTFPFVPADHSECTFPGYVRELTQLIRE